MTSRFSRVTDFIFQKILLIIDELELELPGSIQDRINRAEKKGFIENADLFAEIRILRNEIVHEYTPEEIKEIFKKVLEYTPHVIKCARAILDYCRKYQEK